MKNSGNIALILCIVLAVYIIFDKAANNPGKKIGVVQMEKLVYDFNGMKEATKLYNEKVSEWGIQTDSMQLKLSSLYEQIRLDSLNKDKDKLKNDIRKFLILKKSYTDYAKNVKETASEKDKEMTLGVVNQLNEYIKNYAMEEGYDVILCNSPQQNIGHVADKIDVTEEVLAYSNKKYEGLK